MQEELQERVIEENGRPDTVLVASAPAPEPVSSLGSASLLKLAFVVEYLIALQTILLVWTQVGGQGHMDLLPWYLKLSCIALTAWCLVEFTAALVREPQGWSRSARRWFIVVVLLSVAMASITFYYHLHEIPDEPDTDQTSAKSVRNSGPRAAVYLA